MTEGVLLDVRDLTKRFGGLLLAAALKGLLTVGPLLVVGFVLLGGGWPS